MDIKYSSNKIKKQLSSPSEISKAFGAMAKKVQMRLDEIAAAPNLGVLMQIPAANCHPLRGNKSGEWAVSISGNYRLIFDINHDPVPKNVNGEIEIIQVTDIRIIETTDYH